MSQGIASFHLLNIALLFLGQIDFKRVAPYTTKALEHAEGAEQGSYFFAAHSCAADANGTGPLGRVSIPPFARRWGSSQTVTPLF
jgi:hypothetical protein